jgi:elongation of very long chain fatty acids protein 6
MYSYYALRAMRVSIPRSVNMTITTLQIAQMFAGLYINYRALQFKLLGMPCDISIPVAMTGFTLYGLFAVLFINFFLWTYLFSSKKSIKFINDINHNQEYNNFLKKLQ